MTDIDTYLGELDDLIETHGCVYQGVFPVSDDDPDTYAYTVGLHGHDRAELTVVFPLMSEVENFLRVLVPAHRAEPLQPGAHVQGVFTGYPAAVVAVTDPDAGPFSIARVHAGGEDLTVLQIVWPDPQGRFPWDEGCATTTQPVWGEFVRNPAADRDLYVELAGQGYYSKEKK